jgi:hypothetical protein
MAEGGGFEPPDDVAAVNGFQDRRIQPLCHPSTHGRLGGPALRCYVLADRSRERHEQAGRLYTGFPLSRGEVAEWLKALAC